MSCRISCHYSGVFLETQQRLNFLSHTRPTFVCQVPYAPRLLRVDIEQSCWYASDPIKEGEVLVLSDCPHINSTITHLYSRVSPMPKIQVETESRSKVCGRDVWLNMLAQTCEKHRICDAIFTLPHLSCHSFTLSVTFSLSVSSITFDN
jgi:hypothetical protein